MNRPGRSAAARPIITTIGTKLLHLFTFPHGTGCKNNKKTRVYTLCLSLLFHPMPYILCLTLADHQLETHYIPNQHGHGQT